jgi:hypothetical protein
VRITSILTEVAPLSPAEHGVALVVVATPVGPLAHAIDAYRQAVAVRCGRNAAHLDDAHCLLVRTYRDHPSAVDAYRHVLSETVDDATRRGQRSVTVTDLCTTPRWHGLEIESPALLALAVDFATRATTAARGCAVTRQDRLRLTLAAGFPDAHHEALTELAHRIVDPVLTAQWQVGLWQSSGGAWASVWHERT